MTTLPNSAVRTLSRHHVALEQLAAGQGGGGGGATVLGTVLGASTVYCDPVPSTEKTLLPSATGTTLGGLILPANSCVVGTSIRLSAQGYVRTGTSTSMTMWFKSQGGIALALQVPLNNSQSAFSAQLTLTAKTIGPAADFQPYAAFSCVGGYAGDVAPNTNLDTTLPIDIGWTIYWSAYDANNFIRIDEAVLTVVELDPTA